jgi:hypothetical protein
MTQYPPQRREVRPARSSFLLFRSRKLFVVGSGGTSRNTGACPLQVIAFAPKFAFGDTLINGEVRPALCDSPDIIAWNIKNRMTYTEKQQ